MHQEVHNGGHRLYLGRHRDIESAIGNPVGVTIDQTRRSLPDLKTQFEGSELYFVTDIKHGAPVMELIDATRARLAECVLVFDRVNNRWGLVTQQWFDTEMPEEEPCAVSGSIELPPPTTPASLPLEQPVILSPSIGLETREK